MFGIMEGDEMRYKIKDIKDLKAKIKACKELNLNYSLHGTLKEVEYDIIDQTLSSIEKDMGKMIGDISNFTTKVSFLEEYYNFDVKNLRFKKLKLNFDKLGVEKGEQLEIECIAHKNKTFFKTKYYVLDEVKLYLKKYL